MKKDLHPQEYRDVVFMDEAVGFTFLTKSTAQTDETIEYQGKTYPLVKIYISSKSHPFFTGEEKIIDTEGRVDRFAAKMKAAAEHKAKQVAKSAKKTAKKVEKHIDPVAEKVSEATDKAADTVTEVIENVADKAVEAVEKVSNAKEEAIDNAADAAHKATKKAEEKLDDKK